MTEWDASEYFRQSQLQEVLADEQLALLSFSSSECILDVGCGDGKITAKIAARVPDGFVLGIDPSHDMIAFANSHFGLPEWRNLRFAVADVRNLPYRNKFDLIVSFNALHWVPEQERALRSMRRALKPEGRATLRLVPAGPRKSLEDVIQEVCATQRWRESFQGFPMPYVHLAPEAYADLCKRSGFRVQSVQLTDKAWDFRTREAFLAFCHATCVKWTRRLPEAEIQPFIEDVLNRYRSIAADNVEEANTFKFYQLDVALQRT